MIDLSDEECKVADQMSDCTWSLITHLVSKYDQISIWLLYSKVYWEIYILEMRRDEQRRLESNITYTIRLTKI